MSPSEEGFFAVKYPLRMEIRWCRLLAGLVEVLALTKFNLK